MLKVYSFDGGRRKMLKPVDGKYVVIEDRDYVLEYVCKNPQDSTIYIEGVPLEPADYATLSQDCTLTIRKKFFIDIFGYALVEINGEEFVFDVALEKFKISDIDEIFAFLCSRDEGFFSNFYSTNFSTQKEYSEKVEFLSFAKSFVKSFEMLLPAFEARPHTKIKNILAEEDFSSYHITSYSIDWIFDNIDRLNFTPQPLSGDSYIRINQHTAAIDRIGTQKKINSFDTYENAIIMGSMLFLSKKIQQLKGSYLSMIDSHEITAKSSGDHTSFNDLIKTRYIERYQTSLQVEKKMKQVLSRYQRLFRQTPARIEKPMLTTVFSSKEHYRKAYSLIRRIPIHNAVGQEQLQMGSIKKLSQLYEVYNFHILTDAIKEVLLSSAFSIKESSSRKDGIINLSSFSSERYSINLYYERVISDSTQGDLVRIDTREGSSYCPDYILEIIKHERRHRAEQKLYWIFDSKYSKQETVKNIYLNDCVLKYVLNTGMSHNIYQKAEGLVLLFPAGKSEQIVASRIYKPTIDLIVSKPQETSDVFNYIADLLQSNLDDFSLKLKYQRRYQVAEKTFLEF
ncbi:MAG: hypothetical protein ACK5LR_09625 [Mangrovibacterium sp.]